MNGVRAAKYSFLVASFVVEALIFLVIAGPILGAVTPQMAPQTEAGLGIDLRSVNSQLQFLSSSSTIGGPHKLTFPVFNKWFFPSSVAISLSLAVNGTTVYQTQTASADLAPFQSGTVVLTVDIPPGEIAQLQGHTVTGGGEMTLKEGGLWSIMVNLASG